MRKLALLSLILAVILIAGCSQQPTGQAPTGGAVSQEQPKEPEQAVKKEETLFTESLIFNNPDLKGQITKNKILKTFSSDMDFYINDSMEYVEFFNIVTSMVPFTVNFMCRIFSLGMFNETALEDLYESGNMTAEKEPSFWEGYTATSSHIDFIDKETGEKIAECTSTGPNWEDIKFKAYREYDSSFMGMKIGELPEYGG